MAGHRHGDDAGQRTVRSAPPAQIGAAPGATFRSLLLVCVGNICRSAAAEVMFRHALRERGVQLASAGLAARVGQGMDPDALALLDAAGLDGRGHRARQLDVAMLEAAELVLVMERSHLHQLARIAPHASGKAFLLGKWQGGQAIPDPYRQPRRVFEEVHRMMCEGVQQWLPHL